jgi:predicted amidohydrolase YtcJ
MENQLGRVEKGFMADFAVFAENPLEQGCDRFASMKADMTVLGGEIVYRAEAE